MCASPRCCPARPPPDQLDCTTKTDQWCEPRDCQCGSPSERTNFAADGGGVFAGGFIFPWLWLGTQIGLTGRKPSHGVRCSAEPFPPDGK